ncbi:MAG: PQQ-binding-like beta-propeller repeat protein, partial [Planctomycetota bacterium]
SPVLWKDYVLVNASAVGRQLVAVEQSTGKIAWKIQDDSFTNTWSSPVTVRTDDGDRALFGVPAKIIAVDPASGKQIWTADTPLDDAVCGSICVRDNVAYIMGGQSGRAIAIRMGGEGDVSETHTLWRSPLRAGICTPVLAGKNLHWCSGGIFYAADCETGEYVYKTRLPRIGRPTGVFPNADYSSPIVSGETIVQFTRSGESYVIASGDEFKTVAHNRRFDEDESSFSSTSAIADGQLFVRSERFLYCIASPKN